MLENNYIKKQFKNTTINLFTQSDKEKRDMIQALSHDLRSPLTLIKGHVELLQEGAYKDEERLKRYLNVIEKSTNRAISLVDDLSVLSKIDDSKFTLDKREILLKDFVKDKFDIYKSYARENNIQFNVNMDKELEQVIVYIDKAQISRVIDNIITNSFRYINEEGKIDVDIFENGDKVVFKIKDNGIGFTKEDLINGCNRFYKGDKSRTNGGGNSGLGLYICKKIIDKHNGEIKLFNENGAVVEFSIWKKRIMNIKEIKNHAKSDLRGNLKPLILATIFILIPAALSIITCKTEWSIFVFVNSAIVINLANAILSSLSLKISRCKKVSIRDGLDILKNTDKILLLEVSKYVKLLFLNIFIFIPITFVILTILSDIIPYQMFDSMINILLNIMCILGYIAILVCMSQRNYILNDVKDIPAFEASKKSFELLKKNNLKYIKLELSFAGWFLLSILTFGVGFLYLIPYRYLCLSYFYEEIKEEKMLNYNKYEEVNRNLKIIIAIVIVLLINLYGYSFFKL